MCYAGAEVVSSELIVTSREVFTFSVVAFPEDDDDGCAAAEQARLARDAQFYFDAAEHGSISDADARRYARNVRITDGGSSRIEEREQARRDLPTLVDGMYRNPKTGEIFKVYHTVHGANVQVAKRLTVLAEPYTKTTRGREVEVKAEFVYIGKAGLRELTPAMKMTLEQAKKFSAVYGVCIRCAATLTREESIERAMGPVCIKKI